MSRTIQPLTLIDKYYADNDKARRCLLEHSEQVAALANAVAAKLSLSTEIDLELVDQAAWLHDIGIIFTEAPKIGCHGKSPYISHGIIGAALLRREELPLHALVCERHIGVGLDQHDIQSQQLPLPQRDMRPKSTEEQIVAYADLFFSKSRPGQRTAAEVRKSLARFDQNKVKIFDDWHRRYKL